MTLLLVVKLSGLALAWLALLLPVALFRLFNDVPPLFSVECGAVLLCGLLSCWLHESAHTLAFLAAGGNRWRVTLNWRGMGLVRPRLVSRRAEAAIALCGPAVHLLLALLTFSELRFAHTLGLANACMAGWNLLARRSDGRRAWSELTAPAPEQDVRWAA